LGGVFGAEGLQATRTAARAVTHQHQIDPSLRIDGHQPTSHSSHQPHRRQVHLDGKNQLDYLTGKSKESARNHFFYVSDDGDLTSMRYDNWKIVFL